MSLIELFFALTLAAPPGLNDAGVRAAEERRFCDASSIFVQLHGSSRDPLALYRAAETAFAAGDYLAAIRLYRTLLDNHTSFERANVVESRLNELRAIVAEKGPGTACALPARICGDWIVSAGEACDDGNLKDGDGCDGTCMPTGCGNGAVTGDEICDDGNANNGDGCDDNCTNSACGNGAVATGEGCDDGNVVDGDGCDRNCTVSACGNGVRAANEDCDDGNVEPGDGCSAACSVEAPPRAFAWPVFFGGVAGVVAGAAVIVVGTLPALAHGDARDRVIAAEELSGVNPDVAVANAIEAQAAQQQAQEDWNSWGLPLIFAGSALAVAGVAATAASFFIHLDAEPEAPTGANATTDPDQTNPATSPAASPTASPTTTGATP